MDFSRRNLLVAAGTAALPALPTAAFAATPGLAPPRLSHAFSARITLDPPVEYGMVDGKRSRFIPINGGTVSGPMLEGSVLPGGGDWQTIDGDGRTEVNARYALRSSDDVVISIINPGIRTASPEVIARLSAGEDVDPALYYFYTTPRFEVQQGRYDWMRRKIFVGHGIRRPDHVLLDVFMID